MKNEKRRIIKEREIKRMYSLEKDYRRDSVKQSFYSVAYNTKPLSEAALSLIKH